MHVDNAERIDVVKVEYLHMQEPDTWQNLMFGDLMNFDPDVWNGLYTDIMRARTMSRRVKVQEETEVAWSMLYD
jgi:hypothetical protein